MVFRIGWGIAPETAQENPLQSKLDIEPRSEGAISPLRKVISDLIKRFPKKVL